MTELITADRAIPVKTGRPRKFAEPLDCCVRLGLTKTQNAKVKRNGGTDWIRRLIESGEDCK